MLAGFTKEGRTEMVGQFRGNAGREFVFGERDVPGLRDLRRGKDLLGHRLVHRHGRSEYPGAHVRDVSEVEESLHRPVLAHRAVEKG